MSEETGMFEKTVREQMEEVPEKRYVLRCAFIEADGSRCNFRCSGQCVEALIQNALRDGYLKSLGSLSSWEWLCNANESHKPPSDVTEQSDMKNKKAGIRTMTAESITIVASQVVTRQTPEPHYELQCAFEDGEGKSCPHTISGRFLSEVLLRSRTEGWLDGFHWMCNEHEDTSEPAGVNFPELPKLPQAVVDYTSFDLPPTIPPEVVDNIEGKESWPEYFAGLKSLGFSDVMGFDGTGITAPDPCSMHTYIRLDSGDEVRFSIKEPLEALLMAVVTSLEKKLPSVSLSPEDRKRILKVLGKSHAHNG